MPTDADLETTALQVINTPQKGRRQAFSEALDRASAGAVTHREVAHALDFRARLATRVRQLSELRNLAGPWACP